MAVEIELPDGTRAYYEGRWTCADPKAIPVLNYFTVKVLQETLYEADYANYVAKKVAAVIVGSRVIRLHPAKNTTDKDIYY